MSRPYYSPTIRGRMVCASASRPRLCASYLCLSLLPHVLFMCMCARSCTFNAGVAHYLSWYSNAVPVCLSCLLLVSIAAAVARRFRASSACHPQQLIIHVMPSAAEWIAIHWSWRPSILRFALRLILRAALECAERH